MRDLNKMRERFMRDGLPVRMGNLASNLVRLSNWVMMRHGDQEEIDLMREIAWMIEWCGESAIEDLVDIQREICRWRRIWPVEATRSLLAFRARRMSDRILELSGLLARGKE
jgi:hypothetical protein